jgi:hypothetical protein
MLHQQSAARRQYYEAPGNEAPGNEAPRNEAPVNAVP